MFFNVFLQGGEVLIGVIRAEGLSVQVPHVDFVMSDIAEPSPNLRSLETHPRPETSREVSFQYGSIEMMNSVET